MSNRLNRLLWSVFGALAVLLTGGVVLAQTPTPVPGGDCCAVHSGVGCDNRACQDCVTETQAVCGILPWDQFCVAGTTDPECANICGCIQAPSPTPTPGGDCCSVHGGTGCDVAACQACVCGIDEPCCNLVWDPTCVAEASDECLSQCPCTAPPTETPAPSPTPGGDCCSAHGGPDCNDNACAACVCGLDPECCNGVWDADCASEASVECALECACPGSEPCCGAHDSVSCDDLRCKTCVCDLDPACCTDSWDQRCVDEASVDCQIDCTCDAPGSCCDAHDGIGCEVQACQDCVCAIDAPCCSDGWDARCADEAANDCAERCGACAANNCCEARGDAGCGDDACQACVCNVDGFCCNELWDAGCVSIAEGDCPSECSCGNAPTCAGDCGGDGRVTVNELIAAVNIALGNAAVSTCTAVDRNGDGDVTVNELIQAVNSALSGCG